MILKDLVNDLCIATTDEVSEAIHKGWDEADFKWFVEDGYFLVKTEQKSDTVMVTCYDNDGKEKHCPRLCAYLKDELGKQVFWEKAMSYIGPWGEDSLDPAFSSWDDYYDYKYG